MRTIFLILFLVKTIAINAQVKPLAIGEQITLRSSVLKEDRKLNIYLPPKYDSSKTYPVIYLLDGGMDEDFLHITGLVQFFNLTFSMPETIVIGIENVDRKRDFTYHTDIEDLKKDYPTTGHSASFIKFIETELQPYIIKRYSTNDVKYIIGQSLGGLLATEILFKKPHLFSHYLIVSPSLWWDDQSLLHKADSLLSKHKENEKYVYISVGAGEHEIMVRDAKDLHSIIQKSVKNIKLDFKLMTDENHATILHNSIYEALKKLFPYKE